MFHDRISSIELDTDGIKLDLTKAEQAGAAELVGRLAGTGAGAAHRTRSALDRYVRRSLATTGAGTAASAALEPAAPG